MSSLPAFKLVSDKPAPDVYKLERRNAPRRPSVASITAVCIVDPEGERRRRITTLKTRDVSDTGLGADCEHPLPRGTRVALLIPPHGPESGFDLFGQVVRCRPTPRGYDIGIALDQTLSACA